MTGDANKATEFKDIGALLFRSPPAVRIINLITLYRIVTFPLLVWLAIVEKNDAFKWLLLASFFTDAIDGFLARRFKATSILGAKLDSVGDDLTVLAGAVGLFISEFEFIREQLVVFIALFALFGVQVGLSFYRYKKISTFHTYMAKTAAVITAIFLLSVFFFEQINYPLFYTAAIITGLELVEEIILVIKLKDYRSNVKGLYWVLKKK
jgi:CDP-diacylglycerol--glycerol-3-phosphate 3-phosphatidyltransferase